MGVRELLQIILKETSITKKDLAESLSITEKQLKKWQDYTALPTKFQMLSLLHLASILGIDTSLFSWEKYIEIALSLVFNDDYRIGKGIDEDRLMVHLCGIDGSEGYVPIEEISNKRKELHLEIS